MQSIATGVSNLLATLDDEAAKELRIAQNNHAFKAAVLKAWSDSPNNAHYLLAHINSMYIKKDTAPRKGKNKDKDYYVLGVYLDDSKAKAELNSRRELLKIPLAQEGIVVDEVRDHFSTRGVKERHLYPESIAHLASLTGGIAEKDARKQPHDSTDHPGADQSALLEIVKRAFCMTFVEPDTAWAVLEKIEGAALTETRFRKQVRHGAQWYFCHLYVDESTVDSMKTILDRHGETIICRAKPLGLKVWKFIVHKSPESLRGRQAFPRMGAPVPLESLDVQKLREASAQREESVRVAKEVREKIRKPK